MMRNGDEMIYRKCDYCKKVISGEEAFYVIEIREHGSGRYSADNPLWKREMCRKCYRDGKKFVEKWDGIRT